MKKNDFENWMQEFSDFSMSADVPSNLLVNIKKVIFPNPWRVFFKVAGTHAVVGFFSLSFCNQFGLNPFNSQFTLTDLFMEFGGHNFCMLACGLLFASMTYLVSNAFLAIEELESIKRYEWLQLAILLVGSLAAFYYFGAALGGTVVLFWLLGAFLGGALSLGLSLRLRRSHIF